MNFNEAERRSYKSFLIFILFCLIFSFIFMITNSSKYRVMNINYDNSLSLNFESFETLKYKSIWFINESDFEEFYSSNLVVERLLISKQFPNTLEIEISTHEKILHFTDVRSTLPKVKTLYKNLLISETIESDLLPSLQITNGPIPDGFYSDLISLILTLKKYEVNLEELKLTYNGESLIANYIDTEINIGSTFDLSRKGTVIGYILEQGNCKGSVTILDTKDEDIEALFTCE